jgi:hypothetical protein
MAETDLFAISKSDVERFLYSKHLASCPVCSRFRSNSDLDVRTLSCERGSCSDTGQSPPISVLMIVCQNCGAIQFHDRAVIAHWIECQAKLAAVRA